MKIVKLNDAEGNGIYPVGHSDAIKIKNQSQTLTAKLVEIDTKTDVSVSSSTGVTIGGISDPQLVIDKDTNNDLVYLRFTKGDDTYSVVIPSLRVDGNELQYSNDGQQWDTVLTFGKLSIKYIDSTDPLTGDLGDLALVGDSTNGYDLKVYNGTVWQLIGDISIPSLDAEDIIYDDTNTQFGDSTDNVQKAIEKLSTSDGITMVGENKTLTEKMQEVAVDADFVLKNVEDGGFNNTDGTVSDSDWCHNVEFIPVEEGDVVRWRSGAALTADVDKQKNVLCYYDSNKTKNNYWTYNADNRVLDAIPAGIAYIRASFRKENGYGIDIKKSGETDFTTVFSVVMQNGKYSDVTKVPKLEKDINDVKEFVIIEKNVEDGGLRYDNGSVYNNDWCHTIDYIEVNEGDTVTWRAGDAYNSDYTCFILYDASKAYVGYYTYKNNVVDGARTFTVGSGSKFARASFPKDKDGYTIEVNGVVVFSSVREDSNKVDKAVETAQDLYGALFVDGTEIQKELNWTVGYVNNGSQKKEILSSTGVTSFTQPFTLYAGESVKITSNNTNTAIISKSNASSLAVGDSVDEIIFGNGNSSTANTYTYRATVDTKIVLCCFNTERNSIHFYEGTGELSIKTRLGDVENRIEELEAGADILYSKKDNTINNATNGSAFNCLFFSDIHKDETNFATIKALADKWQSKLNCVINGGDTVEDVASEGLTWYDTVAATFPVDLLSCVGNHDVKNSSGYGFIPIADTFSLIMTPMLNRVSNIQNDGTHLRYYKDYGNIRVIVLDAMEMRGGGKTYGTIQYFADGGATWLNNVLADAKTNNKYVICVNHSPFHSTRSESSGWNVAHAQYGYNDIPSFIQANKNTFHSYYATIDSSNGLTLDMMALEEGAVSAVADFINGGGKFVCWLTGHTHCDFFIDLIDTETYGHQPMINIATARSTYGVSDTDKALIKDCVDFISVNTDLKLLTIVRLGINSDRMLREKNVLTYDFAGHQIVTNY